jgi:lysozyme family protein
MNASRMREIFEPTIESEGGLLTWTNNPRDRGGETVGGVSRVKHPKLRWWADVDAISRSDWGEGPIDLSQYEPVQAIQDGVTSFYGDFGWLYKPADPSRRVHVTDVSSLRVARKLYDLKVNGGTGLLKAGVRKLQALVGTSADGTYGPGTAARVNSYTTMDADGRNESFVQAAVVSLAHGQMLYYAGIVKRDPSQLTFINGWVNRAFDLLP